MKFFSRPILALIATLGVTGIVHAHAADNLGSASVRPTESMPTADHVIVHKGERRMVLMRGDSILRTYKIALGLNPIGHKERAGDFRTPEGRYFLTRRNPRSDFFLSIQVSYPNDA